MWRLSPHNIAFMGNALTTYSIYFVNTVYKVDMVSLYLQSLCSDIRLHARLSYRILYELTFHLILFDTTAMVDANQSY